MITNKNSESLLMINEELSRLAQLAEQAVAAPKRPDQRYAFNTPLTIGLLEKSGDFKPICEAWGLDLSNVGIGILSPRSFSKGDVRYLMIPLPAYKKMHVTAIIQRCKQVSPEFYLLGATFIFEDITAS